jgi:hypothetical protein
MCLSGLTSLKIIIIWRCPILKVFLPSPDQILKVNVGKLHPHCSWAITKLFLPYNPQVDSPSPHNFHQCGWWGQIDRMQLFLPYSLQVVSPSPPINDECYGVRVNLSEDWRVGWGASPSYCPPLRYCPPPRYCPSPCCCSLFKLISSGISSCTPDISKAAWSSCSIANLLPRFFGQLQSKFCDGYQICISKHISFQIRRLSLSDQKNW